MRSSTRRTTVAIEHRADRTVSATPVSILLPVHLHSAFFRWERCECLLKPKAVGADLSLLEYQVLAGRLRQDELAVRLIVRPCTTGCKCW